jgi:PleD family two-component response regulator
MNSADGSTTPKRQAFESISKPVFATGYSVQEETLRVLHVDDDASSLSVSKTILEIENKFEIDNVSSVDEAFRRMSQRQYDAVVSDYQMSQKNGLEFLKETIKFLSSCLLGKAEKTLQSKP